MGDKGLTQVVPGQRYLIVPGHKGFRPVRTKVPGLLELGFDYLKTVVSERSVHMGLQGPLQPASHGDVVGIDSGLIIGKLTYDEEDVAGSTW